MLLLKGHSLINSPMYLLLFFTYWSLTCGKVKSLLPETHQAQDTCLQPPSVTTSAQNLFNAISSQLKENRAGGGSKKSGIGVKDKRTDS